MTRPQLVALAVAGGFIGYLATLHPAGAVEAVPWLLGGLAVVRWLLSPKAAPPTTKPQQGHVHLIVECAHCGVPVLLNARADVASGWAAIQAPPSWLWDANNNLRCPACVGTS